MRFLLLAITLTLLSCQTAQKVCEIPDPYRLVEVGRDSSESLDIYIGIGETDPANKELYANEGMLAIKPVPFFDAMRALIHNGMLCQVLGHAPGLDGTCLLCGKALPMDSL